MWLCHVNVLTQSLLQLIGTWGPNCLLLAIDVIDSSSDVVVSSSVVQFVEAELEPVDSCSLVVLLGVAGVAGMFLISSGCGMSIVTIDDY